MKVLKVEVIQPGISDKEPVAVWGVFPYSPKNLEKVINRFTAETPITSEQFDEYVTDQLHNYIDVCIPLAIKKEDGLIHIILQQPNDTSS